MWLKLGYSVLSICQFFFGNLPTEKIAHSQWRLLAGTKAGMRVPIAWSPHLHTDPVHFPMRLQDLCLSCPSLRSWQTFRSLASGVLAAKPREASAVTIPPATQASLALVCFLRFVPRDFPAAKGVMT